MQTKLGVLLLLLVLLAAPAGRAEEDDGRIERLVALARVWGEIEVFHPWLVTRDIDWDRALLDAIPLVEAAGTPEALRAAYGALLAPLGDPLTRAEPAQRAPTGVADWKAPSVRWIDESTALLTGRTWETIPRLSAAWLESADLYRAFDESRKAKVVVLDLRRDPAERGGRWGPYLFAMVLDRALPRLLDGRVRGVSLRRRIHMGYASRKPQFNRNPNAYTEGLLLEAANDIPGDASGGAAPRLVFVVDEGCREFLGTLRALQAAGRGTIVFEGDPGVMAPMSLTHEIAVPGGVRIIYRKAEFVDALGGAVFRPDVVIERAADAKEDVALVRALELARRVPEPRPRAPSSALPGRVRVETREDAPFPGREQRLLALFRFWNVIERWFPYRDLMDEPWEDALREFIPRFEAAVDALEYGLAVAEMGTLVQDTHFKVTSPALDAYVGTHVPKVRVDEVERRLLVTEIYEEGLKESVRPGDEVLTIDGSSVADLRKKIARVTSVSTPQSLRYRAEQKYLAGAEGTEAVLGISRADGTKAEVRLPRTLPRMEIAKLVHATSKLPVFGMLGEGIGYVDLVRLRGDQADRALAATRAAKAIILDQRGYVAGGSFRLAWLLNPRSPVSSQFRLPLLLHPAEGGAASLARSQRVGFTAGPGEGEPYGGHIVVLIDEQAISAAEHTCLNLEAAARRITFVGSPTTGANGTVSYCPLPGAVEIRWTGLDVRHADGRQLQRVGIQPDVRIDPTVAGVRAGKDEVLEAALTYLSGNLEKD